MSQREPPYTYDLLFDIKTTDELQEEVEYLTHRLSSLAKLRREDGHPIDDYIVMVLDLPT